MKKPLLLLFLLIAASSFSYAQGTRNPQPDSLIKIIPLQGDIYGLYRTYNVPYGYSRSTLYTIGGKLVAPEDVTHRLLNYGPSAAEYKAAKRNVTTAYILFSGTAAAGFGSVLAFAHGAKTVTTYTNINGMPFPNYSYQHNYTGAVILTGVAIGLATAAILSILHSSRHLNKSVWLYNLRFQ